MFTRKDFEFQAEILGSHVIPMCTRFDWNAGGARHWDLNRVNDYLNLGTFIVAKFQENPAFDLDRFNKRISQWFVKWIETNGSDYLLWDLPGMELTGNEPRRDWTFKPQATMSY